MTEDDIAAIFIKAAEIERKMPRKGEKPIAGNGYALPWVHSFADINGWRYQPGDQYERDDRLRFAAQFARDFWEGRTTRANTEDVNLWETCIEWTGTLLDNENQRRALWAWAFSKAGGKPFKRWCEKVEHVSRTIGLKRKNAAITRIYAQLVRGDVQNIENTHFGGLQVYSEIGDIPATVGSEDGKRDDPNFWSEDAAFKSFLPTYTKHRDGEISVEDRQFSIRAARNAERRARYARMKAA